MTIPPSLKWSEKATFLSPPSIKVKGKRLLLWSRHKKKADAVKKADKLRSQGYLARVRESRVRIRGRIAYRYRVFTNKKPWKAMVAGQYDI